MSNPAPIQKLGEIQLPRVENAQLARLDPSTPYIVLLPSETPNAVVEKLVAFFGKANVLATVLVGDPRNFRMFASLSWSATPVQTPTDIHPLNLVPDSQIGAILKKHFVSALHEDAEAVEGIYPQMLEDGIGICQSDLEAMVRVGILRFQALQELRRISDPGTWTQDKTAARKPTKAIAPAPTYQLSQIVTLLNEFVDPQKQSLYSVQVEDLAKLIAEQGTSSNVENMVLVYQNRGILGSGVLTVLRSDYPEVKKATKTKRAKTTGATKTARKRVSKKK